MLGKFTTSPSRTYVAVCYKPNFDGVYFKKFILPDGYGDAVWYFLNRLNVVACIEDVITFEDYQNITEQDYQEKEATV